MNSIESDNELSKMSLKLLRTQVGCLLLQEKSIVDHKFANELLFPEIKNNLKEICCNLFSNNLIQVLIDILTFDNLDKFLFSIKYDILNICLNEYGSRVIQKLIERIHDYPVLVNKLISLFKNKDIGKIFISPYGNHIFQKYVTIFRETEFTNFIYNYMFDNFINIIKTKYGVSVIQKGFSQGNCEQRKTMNNLIINNFDNIMKDCYANFLIYYILIKYEIKNFTEILPILEKIEGNIVEYCKNKYSASVIEKCCERGKKEIIEHILKYLIDNHSESIIDILLNSYGIYIIKKALKIENKDIND